MLADSQAPLQTDAIDPSGDESGLQQAFHHFGYEYFKAGQQADQPVGDGEVPYSCRRLKLLPQPAAGV